MSRHFVGQHRIIGLGVLDGLRGVTIGHSVPELDGSDHRVFLQPRHSRSRKTGAIAPDRV
jgi:hypothetical protein